MTIVDQDMVKRVEDINQMPEELKNHVLHFIDMAIRDHKARKAYNQAS